MSFPVATGPIRASLDANQKADLTSWLELLELEGKKVVATELLGRLNGKNRNRLACQKDVSRFVRQWKEQRSRQPMEAT